MSDDFVAIVGSLPRAAKLDGVAEDHVFGVYQQVDPVNRRPSYKRLGKDIFLWYYPTKQQWLLAGKENVGTGTCYMYVEDNIWARHRSCAG